MYTATGRLERSHTLESYLPLVRRQALSLQVRLPDSVELDDLIQAGTVGLLDAFERYESDQGAAFATYASQRIRGAMLDELRSRDWLPRRVRRQAREARDVAARLAAELGREPREREIAEALDMTPADYRRLVGDVNKGLIVSYEEEGSEESAPSHVDDSVALGEDPLALSLADARHSDLASAIDALPERERTLLGLYYQEDLNLKEIGAVLGVSESRVCQIHSQAVKKLRAKMTDHR